MLIACMLFNLQAENLVSSIYEQKTVWRQQTSSQVACAPSEQQAHIFMNRLGTGQNFQETTKKINNQDIRVSWAAAEAGISLRCFLNNNKRLDVYLFGIGDVNHKNVSKALEFYYALCFNQETIFSTPQEISVAKNNPRVRAADLIRENKDYPTMETVPMTFVFENGQRIVQVPKNDALMQPHEVTRTKQMREKILQIQEKITHTEKYQHNLGGIPSGFYEDVQISVENKKTDVSGQELLKDYDKVGLPVWANAVSLGGGIRNGRTAQEESMMLAYPQLWISYLDFMERMHPNLDADRKKRFEVLKTAPYIAPQEILVTKLPRDHNKQFVVLAGAAAYLKRTYSNSNRLILETRYGDDEIYAQNCPEDVEQQNNQTNFIDQPTYENNMKDAIRNLILAAKDNGVEALVLGAWGCGVYNHDPKIVARLFKDVLDESIEGTSYTLKHYFKKIVFAIYDKSPNTNNFQAFEKMFPKPSDTPDQHGMGRLPGGESRNPTVRSTSRVSPPSNSSNRLCYSIQPDLVHQKGYIYYKRADGQPPKQNNLNAPIELQQHWYRQTNTPNYVFGPENDPTVKQLKAAGFTFMTKDQNIPHNATLVCVGSCDQIPLAVASLKTIENGKSGRLLVVNPSQR